MQRLDERLVSNCLQKYFLNCGLSPLGKRSPFTHPDDLLERSFEIDLVVGPVSKLGDRSQDELDYDHEKFSNASNTIDRVIKDLLSLSLFPGSQISRRSWNWSPNPNPVYGLAIEIENQMTKYFLGSLLAAAITGRWGILIAPEKPLLSKWINTIERMMHKGTQSPIPTNIVIFSWPTLEKHLTQCEQDGAGQPDNHPEKS